MKKRKEGRNESIDKKEYNISGTYIVLHVFWSGKFDFPAVFRNQAGVNVWIAMAGFAVTAIGFPIFGVAAVAKSGGLDVLAKRVHPVFASIFTLLIYVSIGRTCNSENGKHFF